MPAPDPHGLWMEDRYDGGPGITFELWAQGNRANRTKRARRIAENIKHDGWCCSHCGEPIPLFKRADADYCRTSYRKAAARLRIGLARNAKNIAWASWRLRVAPLAGDNLVRPMRALARGRHGVQGRPGDV